MTCPWIVFVRLQEVYCCCGNISILRSDRETNFRASDKELREALEEWNNSGLGRKLQQTGVDWQVNTVAASHHGGAHERIIRSARACLRHVTEQQTLTDESLITLFAEAEFVLNSRPLQPFSSNPGSLRALCPNDILLGRPVSSLPPGIFPTEGLLKRKWKQVQQLADQFWRRFRQEYLHLLSLRAKWLMQRRNFSVGDLVLVSDANLLHAQWTLARVTAVKANPNDAMVSSIRVKTATTELERPITKIVLLEGCDD